MKYYTKFDTELCEIILVGDEDGLSNLHLNTGKGKREFSIDPLWKRDDAFFCIVKKQIEEYVSGNRKDFDLKLNPDGTNFFKSAWVELLKIPYCELRTYQDLAIKLGNRNASRAVGLANSKNPIPLIIPCHRVVGKSGKLTGFAHGLEIKQQLIDLEQRFID
jgi:methylated-DNA-[protein]-cysteine S-methyltransferase